MTSGKRRAFAAYMSCWQHCVVDVDAQDPLARSSGARFRTIPCGPCNRSLGKKKHEKVGPRSGPVFGPRLLKEMVLRAPFRTQNPDPIQGPRLVAEC